MKDTKTTKLEKENKKQTARITYLEHTKFMWILCLCFVIIGTFTATHLVEGTHCEDFDSWCSEKIETEEFNTEILNITYNSASDTCNVKMLLPENDVSATTATYEFAIESEEDLEYIKEEKHACMIQDFYLWSTVFIGILVSMFLIFLGWMAYYNKKGRVLK